MSLSRFPGIDQLVANSPQAWGQLRMGFDAWHAQLAAILSQILDSDGQLVSAETANNSLHLNGKVESALSVAAAASATNSTRLGGKLEGDLNANSALFANSSTYLNGKAEADLNANSALHANNSAYLGGQLPAFYRDASNLNAGTVPTARLGSGTADNTTFLRGDQTWAVPAGGGGGTAGLKLDDISASFNGVTTTFALTSGGGAVQPGAEVNLVISVDGVIQEPVTAYTVSGDDITFTAAPATGATFFGVLLPTAVAAWTEPTGTVKAFAGSSAPTGYLLCDGTFYEKTGAQANLFAIIGTTFGSNTTHFAVPDARGRAVIGVGTGTGLTARALGATVGTETHVLATSEMPSHTHVQDAHTHVQNSHNHTQDAHAHSIPGNPSGAGSGSSIAAGDQNYSQSVTSPTLNATATNQAATAVNQNATAVNQNTGGGGAHQNMQPSLALNFIIKN